MSDILVTGGYGFIGHNVVKRLKELKHNVIVVDSVTDYGIIPGDEIGYLNSERKKRTGYVQSYNYDITNEFAMTKMFKTVMPDIVIHLASFPRQKVVNNNPTAGAKVMAEGLIKLLEESKRHNVKRFVYISSSMVYGDFADGVVEEALCNPQGQYGIMKLAGELLTKDYATKGHFDHTVIRPSAVYGPYDVEDRVVSKFFMSAMRNETLKVNGANEKLDFTYVDDTADGIVAATLSDNTKNKTYNITKGVSHTLLDAAQLITKIVGKGNIQVQDKDNNFPARGRLSIEKAKRDFGYNPQIDIEEGFTKYYEYLKNSPFWVSKTV